MNVDDPVGRGLVAAEQTTWRLIVANPWALAQFGTFDEGRLRLTQGEYDVIDKSVFPKESQGKIRPGMRLDTLVLGSVGEGRDAVAEALARPNKKYLWVVDGRDIDHGSHDGTMVGFSPESAIQHLKTAIFTLLPATGFALLAALVGLSIVICQVVLAPLLLFLPLPLFAMMVPGAGWAFAARYFRTLLGFFLVKLVYGLYLSLVLVTGTAFSGALIKDNLGAAMVVLALIFFAAAVYRKKFLNFALESVQKGALINHNKVSLDRIMAANAVLARKMGLTDIFSDWVFSGRGRGGGPGRQPPPGGDGGTETVGLGPVLFPRETQKIVHRLCHSPQGIVVLLKKPKNPAQCLILVFWEVSAVPRIRNRLTVTRIPAPPRPAHPGSRDFDQAIELFIRDRKIMDARQSTIRWYTKHLKYFRDYLLERRLPTAPVMVSRSKTLKPLINLGWCRRWESNPHGG